MFCNFRINSNKVFEEEVPLKKVDSAAVLSVKMKTSESFNDPSA